MSLLLPPSRYLLLAIVLLLLMAGLAMHGSSLPDVSLLMLPLLAWLGLRACQINLPLSLWLRQDGSAAQMEASGNAHPVRILALHERGPLGVLVLERDGRILRLPWASDSLPRASRRELRLWIGDHVQRPATSVAKPSTAP